MNKDLTTHVASILKISEDDSIIWIEEDKVIRKWLKSESSAIDRSNTETSSIIDDNGNDNTDMLEAGIDKDDKVAKPRSIFMLDGQSVRLETVFILWFERTGNRKKKETIERYLQGKTKARKGLKGYLKSASASIEDLDTFVLLFNLLLSDKKLALNGGSE